MLVLPTAEEKTGGGGGGGDKCTLRMAIKQARQLPQMDSNGLTDGVVKCHLLPDRSTKGKRKTHVIKNNLNPVWEEKFGYEKVSLEELSRERVLEVSVWDYDRRGNNEFIGGLRLGPAPGRTPKHKEWMDCIGDEVSHWEAMLSRPGEWVEQWHTLRPSMEARILDLSGETSLPSFPPLPHSSKPSSSAPSSNEPSPPSNRSSSSEVSQGLGLKQGQQPPAPTCAPADNADTTTALFGVKRKPVALLPPQPTTGAGKEEEEKSKPLQLSDVSVLVRDTNKVAEDEQTADDRLREALDNPFSLRTRPLSSGEKGEKGGGGGGGGGGGEIEESSLSKDAEPHSQQHNMAAPSIDVIGSSSQGSLSEGEEGKGARQAVNIDKDESEEERESKEVSDSNPSYANTIVCTCVCTHPEKVTETESSQLC